MLKAILLAILMAQTPPLLSPGPQESLDSPRAFLSRAIQAHGGADRLTQYPAVTWRATGKIYSRDRPVAYTADFAREHPKRDRAEMRFNDEGKTWRIIVVTAANQAWEIFDDQMRDFTPAELAEERERLHADWVQTLQPLVKGEGFTLAYLPELEIDGHRAIGVRVSAKGHRDVKLYFGKESKLLMKGKTTNVDVDSGKEFVYEEFYEAYKDFGGLKFYTRRKSKKDGKLLSESENSDFKPMEKLDDKLFAKP
jgi:hypothetical protein